MDTDPTLPPPPDASTVDPVPGHASTLDGAQPGLSIAEYAHAHQVSTKTVRRRIKGGALHAIKTTGTHGDEYRILGTVDAGPVHPTPPPTVDTVHPTRKPSTVDPPPHVHPTPGQPDRASTVDVAPTPPSAYESRWVAALEREHHLAVERTTLQARLDAAAEALTKAQEERDFLRGRVTAAELAVNRQQEIALRAQHTADQAAAELADVRRQLTEAQAPKALPGAEPENARRSWWQWWK